jgi:prepilin-type processing-associated H-X9-DG protein
MLAMLNYETQYRVFPPGRVGCDCETWGPCKTDPRPEKDAIKRPSTSGFALILPQLDERPIYDLFRGFAKGGLYPGDTLPLMERGDEGDSSVGWKTPQCGDNKYTEGWNTGELISVAKAYVTRPPIFVCPSDRTEPRYGPDSEANAGPNGDQDLRPAVGSYAMSMGPLGPDIYNEGDEVSGTYPTYTALSGNTSIRYRKEGTPGPIQVKYQNLGPFVYFYPRGTQDIRDGLSQTIFLGEVKDGSDSRLLAGGAPNRWAVAWAMADSLRSTYNGIDYSENYRIASTTLNTGRAFAGYFGSNHGPGANFAFGDGNVRYLPCTIDILVLYALSTINNGYYEAKDSEGNPFQMPD